MKSTETMFSKSLQKLRKRAGINQTDLANMLGVKQYVISGWEIGRSEPNIDQLRKLSTILNVPCDYLLGKEIVNVDNKQYKTLTNNFELDIRDQFLESVKLLTDPLSEEQKDEILSMVRSACILATSNAPIVTSEKTTKKEKKVPEEIKPILKEEKETIVEEKREREDSIPIFIL